MAECVVVSKLSCLRHFRQTDSEHSMKKDNYYRIKKLIKN